VRGTPAVADTVLGWRFVNERFPERFTVSLGETAEIVAARYDVGRDVQDAFALRSQERASAAQRAGRFADELVAVEVRDRKGRIERVIVDEQPRPDTTIEQLAGLRPAFRSDGTVTAGNSSGLNDGAAALTVVGDAVATSLGRTPLARYITSAVAGVEPDCMGMGPVPAVRRALRSAGLSVQDIALFEITEAFAAQTVACLQQLEIDPDRVNVNGGAIALGHPLGCSGARLMTTLVHELRRRGGGYGLATMCIGVGQGIATIVEVAK
jgi:acetyl-CoA acetyltransferase family protein